MNKLISLYIGIISTLLTFVIAIFATLQWRIAKNKRQDDLFNIRYKLYERTIDFIIELKNHVSEQDDEKSMKILKGGLNNKHLGIAQNIIFESKCLFGVDIADHLTKYFFEKHLLNIIYKGIDKHKKEGYWIPPIDFIKPFEKYLTIKNPNKFIT